LRGAAKPLPLHGGRAVHRGSREGAGTSLAGE